MKTRLTALFREFLESEQAAGIALVLCTIVSIAFANSFLGDRYVDFWHAEVGLTLGGIALPHTVAHWINDGLMAVFFLLIGLEIERELYIGELSSPRQALLPVVAAVGGMAVPALLHFLLNRGTETQAGMGIPMATDIAFALGALSLLGRGVPASLKVFLVALAIIDDLGAIVVIALFYAGSLSLPHLLLASGVFAGLVVMNRLGVRRLPLFLIPGVVMWYFLLKSGIHATLAGVLLAFATPFGRGDAESPSCKLQGFLHKPVAFFILPLFALANTGVPLAGDWADSLRTANSLGIFAGLFIGKPLGITLFVLLAIKLGLSRLPGDLRWGHIVGAGFLGGIGFTMSIFITLLAFESRAIIESAKIAVLLSSLVAGVTGFLILNRLKPPR